jgi:hypothetical protein
LKFCSIIEPNLPGQCKNEPRHTVQTAGYKTGFFLFYSGPCERPKKGAKSKHCPGADKSLGPVLGVPMPESRRRLFISFVGAVGVLVFKPLLSAWQAAGTHPTPQPPQPRPSPNAPDANVPYGLKGPQATTSVDQKTIDRAKQQELRSDVSRLYEMVSELKEQVENTNTTSTLSLSVVKKAQQIEKLAKQIKEVAKG